MAASWLPGYIYRRKLTIDNTKIGAALVNFPVLVELVAGNFDWDKCNNDGLDIRFTASDGTTVLKYEREQWDFTNSLATFHVKVPAVSDSADTEIYIYFRTPDSNDGEDAQNVWDGYYSGVYHLSELGDNPQVLDSTSNLNHSTTNRANAVAAGKIYRAMAFYSFYNDYITFPPLLDEAEGTIELWAKGMALGAVNPMFADDGNGYCVLRMDENNKPSFGVYDTSMHWATGTTDLDATNWFYLTGLFASNTLPEIWLSGIKEGEGTNWIGVLPDITLPVKLGKLDTTYFRGSIDEFRCSTVKRSAAWVLASHHSTNDGLMIYGSLETSTESFNEIITLDSEIVFEVTLESEISIQRS